VTAVFTAANPEMVQRDENFKNMFRNAPAVIAIAVPEGDSGLNAGLMAENMILAAQSLGLGTCCLGGPVAFLKTNPDAAWFLEGLKFSEGYNLCLMIAVGYPDETPEAKARDLDKIKFIDWE
jgi:nitroreductase